MGHTGGFAWTPEILRRVRDARISGLTYGQIAVELSTDQDDPVTAKGVERAWTRYRPTLDMMLERRADVPTYVDEHVPDDNYIVSCDYHAPYHSEVWINRLLLIAEKFKIHKHIIIGDLFDMSFASYYRAKDGEQRPSLDDESNACRPIFKALDYFDQNILINGNHESRIGNLTESKIEARHLFGLFGAEVWEKKFRYLTQDKLFVGDSWLLVHPKSYSQISASVAVRLAEKYHRNVLNAHGHFCAMRFDRSGDYMAVDLGGMFDVGKIAYVHFSSSTHPNWNAAFGAIVNGEFHLFHEQSPWNWLLA